MQSFLRFFALPGLALVGLAFLWACSEDFLEVEPTGSLNQNVLANVDGVDGLLIGAYAQLNGRGNWFGGASNWANGSIQGGDANKGTNDGDFTQINDLVRYQLSPTSQIPSDRWNALFEGVSRSNSVLTLLPIAGENDSRVAGQAGRLEGEARFLRGHYYFSLKLAFDQAPILTPGLTPTEQTEVPSTRDLWGFIEEDFMFAMNNLPETQSAVGRANKWAAAAYLAKTYIFQEKWGEARTLLNDIYANGVTAAGERYRLLDDYSQIFNADFDNHPESVFAVQSAVNLGNVNTGNPDFALNFPHNTGSTGPGNCCGFFQPSFDLANSFRTEDGLPLPGTSYREAGNELTTDQGIAAADPYTVDDKPVDPRLDHSVGRRGIPYLGWGPHPGVSWIRDQPYAGPYSPKKFVYYASQEGTLSDGSGWTRGYPAMNYNIIRFADVILWLAEAEIQLGDLERGRELINEVRSRAANEVNMIMLDDGSPAANYEISTYDASFASQQAALDALMFERKLELSGEGHRFFDLRRWGRAESFLNPFIDYEQQYLPVAYDNAQFTAPQDLYYPIPQGQIDLQGTDILQQNPGY